MTAAELRCYRRMKLPVPRRHFIERYKARLKKRLEYELHERSCDKCEVVIQTAYGRSEKGPYASLRVYCEKCYLETVY